MEEGKLFTAACDYDGSTTYRFQFKVVSENHLKNNGVLSLYHEKAPGYFFWGTELWENTRQMCYSLQRVRFEGDVTIRPNFFLDECKVFGYVLSTGRENYNIDK